MSVSVVLAGWVLTEVEEFNADDDPDSHAGCKSRVITGSLRITLTVALSYKSAVEMTLKN